MATLSAKKFRAERRFVFPIGAQQSLRMKRHLPFQNRIGWIICASFLLFGSGEPGISQLLEPAAGISRQQVEAAAMGRKFATEQMARNIEPSLRLKENVDFLLTPALLMQEAISDQTVLTYPTE